MGFHPVASFVDETDNEAVAKRSQINGKIFRSQRFDLRRNGALFLFPALYSSLAARRTENDLIGAKIDVELEVVMGSIAGEEERENRSGKTQR